MCRDDFVTAIRLSLPSFSLVGAPDFALFSGGPGLSGETLESLIRLLPKGSRIKRARPTMNGHDLRASILIEDEHFGVCRLSVQCSDAFCFYRMLMT